MAGLGQVWSVLREPLTSLSFASMKEVAAASGLPTVQLSELRQTSSGGRGASKSELADAIDALFNKLDPHAQDRAAGHLIHELLERSTTETRERLEELLERVGWHVVAGEPAPLTLRLDASVEVPPEVVTKAIAKSIRRFRDRDFDGAITSIVGVIDTLTEDIYDRAGLAGHKKTSYQQRAITAHKQLESAFRGRLVGMSLPEAELTWAGRQRSVNGAADVLGAYRRNFADAHGSGSANPKLVQDALESALFLVNCLTD